MDGLADAAQLVVAEAGVDGKAHGRLPDALGVGEVGRIQLVHDGFRYTYSITGARRRVLMLALWSLRRSNSCRVSAVK